MNKADYSCKYPWQILNKWSKKNIKVTSRCDLLYIAGVKSFSVICYRFVSCDIALKAWIYDWFVVSFTKEFSC